MIMNNVGSEEKNWCLKKVIELDIVNMVNGK